MLRRICNRVKINSTTTSFYHRQRCGGRLGYSPFWLPHIRETQRALPPGEQTHSQEKKWLWKRTTSHSVVLSTPSPAAFRFRTSDLHEFDSSRWLLLNEALSVSNILLLAFPRSFSYSTYLYSTPSSDLLTSVSGKYCADADHPLHASYVCGRSILSSLMHDHRQSLIGWGHLII